MSGTTIFLLLLVGLPLAMMFMRGGAGGMGCGMGHSRSATHDHGTETALRDDGAQKAAAATPSVAERQERHRGCC